eukprot:scaffold2119_cov264-Pinguiococcus_pyrenoidosus.AAC.19
MVQAHTRAICHCRRDERPFQELHKPERHGIRTAEIIGKIGREVDGTAHANQVLHSERAEAPPVLGFHGVSVRHAGEARRLQPSVLHPSGEVAHNPPVAQVGTERRSAWVSYRRRCAPVRLSQAPVRLCPPGAFKESLPGPPARARVWICSTGLW